MRHPTTERRRVPCSVVIAFGGNESNLMSQLSALAKQVGCDPFDIVVSCNSTESSPPDILERARQVSPQMSIRCIDSSHRPGPSFARNLGWRSTDAELVLFCDDDDVVDESWVGAMQRALWTVDAVGGRNDYVRLNASGDDRWNLQSVERLPIKFGHLVYSPSSNLGVRRVALEAIDGFDEVASHAEDIDFCWRLQYAGFTMAFAPDAVGNYRLRPTAREVWSQSVRYGTSDGWLMRKHLIHGSRRTVRDSIVDLKSLVSVTLGAAIGRRPFRMVAARYGNAWGRVIGSIRYQVWVL